MVMLYGVSFALHASLGFGVVFGFSPVDVPGIGVVPPYTVQATADGVAIVHRRADGTLLGVGQVPDVPALPGLTGQWSPDGASLVLQAGARAWLVTTPTWTTGGRDG